MPPLDVESLDQRLREALGAPDPAVRLYAVRLLADGGAGPEHAADILQTLLRVADIEPYEAIRDAALGGLFKRPEDEAFWAWRRHAREWGEEAWLRGMSGAANAVASDGYLSGVRRLHPEMTAEAAEEVRGRRALELAEDVAARLEGSESSPKGMGAELQKKLAEQAILDLEDGYAQRRARELRKAAQAKLDEGC
jgi:hypothetical protein